MVSLADADDEPGVRVGRAVRASDEMVGLEDQAARLGLGEAVAAGDIGEWRRMQPPSRAMTMSRTSDWISSLSLAVSDLPWRRGVCGASKSRPAS